MTEPKSMKPWKPTDGEPSPVVRTGRAVTFPPVASFGRLERDKWLAVKTLEEAAELTEASKDWLKASDTDRPARREAMLSEYADVLQTLANLAVAYDITDEEIKDAMGKCLERNRARGRM